MKLIYPNTAFSMPLKWFTVVPLLVLFPLLLTFAFKFLVSFSFSLLLLKNFIDTVFLIVFAMILEKIIPFTNYVKLDFRQRLINSLALAIISVSVWVLITYSSSVILFGIEARDEIIIFEANLHPQKFVRINRSYIVNVEKIARIELFEKNSQMLMLKNGHQIKASTTGYKILREVLNL